MRHAHASLLVHLGADIKSAQRRLGHSVSSVTLDVYSRALPEGERRLVQALDEALGRG